MCSCHSFEVKFWASDLTEESKLAIRCSTWECLQVWRQLHRGNRWQSKMQFIAAAAEVICHKLVPQYQGCLCLKCLPALFQFRQLPKPLCKLEDWVILDRLLHKEHVIQAEYFSYVCPVFPVVYIELCISTSSNPSTSSFIYIFIFLIHCTTALQCCLHSWDLLIPKRHCYLHWGLLRLWYYLCLPQFWCVSSEYLFAKLPLKLPGKGGSDM